MYALLVKPAVWKKKRFSAFVNDWVKQGAHLIAASTIADIRDEISGLVGSSHQPVTVVACGGDGTVHLLLNAVVDLPVNFAVVPFGTGNDFARHLGIKNIEQARSAIFNGELTTIDIGEIRTAQGVRYFGGIASCGFDAQVNERANGYRGPQGTAKYVAALIAELRALAPLKINVNDNAGQRDAEVTLLAVGNTASYGGGMKVCPQAKVNDGLLEVIQVGPVGRGTLLRVFPRVFRGTHTSHPAVTMSQTETISIGGDPFPVYADGERVGLGPVHISVVPKALTVWQRKERQ